MAGLWVVNTIRSSGFRSAEEVWQLLAFFRRNMTENPLGIISYNSFIDLEFVAFTVGWEAEQYWLSGRFLSNRDVAADHARTLSQNFNHLLIEYYVADPAGDKVIHYRFQGQTLFDTKQMPPGIFSRQPHDPSPCRGAHCFSLTVQELKTIEQPDFQERLLALR